MKRFRIAFSFAGEKRDFVSQVAGILAERFGEAAILYDKFHEAEFANWKLGLILQELYHDHSDMIAANCHRLALALVQQGKAAEALSYARRAVEIYTRLGSPDLEVARAILAECEG